MQKFNLILYVSGAFIGAIAGYGYYTFVGCSSGACAISSNPYISTVYGIIFGILLASLFTKSRKKTNP